MIEILSGYKQELDQLGALSNVLLSLACAVYVVDTLSRWVRHHALSGWRRTIGASQRKHAMRKQELVAQEAENKHGPGGRATWV